MVLASLGVGLMTATGLAGLGAGVGLTTATGLSGLGAGVGLMATKGLSGSGLGTGVGLTIAMGLLGGFGVAVVSDLVDANGLENSNVVAVNGFSRTFAGGSACATA